MNTLFEGDAKSTSVRTADHTALSGPVHLLAGVRRRLPAATEIVAVIDHGGKRSRRLEVVCRTGVAGWHRVVVHDGFLRSRTEIVTSITREVANGLIAAAATNKSQR